MVISVHLIMVIDCQGAKNIVKQITNFKTGSVMALSCRILQLSDIKEQFFKWNTLAGNGFSRLLEIFIHRINII